MRILEINSVNYGSTGKIMNQIADMARKNGHEVWTACAARRSTKKLRRENHIFIGNTIGRQISEKLSYFTGYQGRFAFFATVNFLRKVKKINPDVIHLHNLHNSYINIPLLCSYIKKSKKIIVWTLHDCWGFTGQCAYFTMANCEKWKMGCYMCTQISEYPQTRKDRTSIMWKKKREWFSDIDNLVITTPSKWLEKLVKESFLASYKIITIENGIDTEQFHYQVSNIRRRYKIQEPYILLGAASTWSTTKGIDVFVELAERLNSDYKIVLIGTDNEIDKLLPDNIISIHRTFDVNELVELYSGADLFVNPTRQEVFGLVNVEALACGTPVLAYNTGGCPEIVNDSCGKIIDENIDELVNSIKQMCEQKEIKREECVKHAQKYDFRIINSKYVALYEELYHENCSCGT